MEQVLSTQHFLYLDASFYVQKMRWDHKKIIILKIVVTVFIFQTWSCNPAEMFVFNVDVRLLKLPKLSDTYLGVETSYILYTFIIIAHR